jgi:hypothetical protein
MIATNEEVTAARAFRHFYPRNALLLLAPSHVPQISITAFTEASGPATLSPLSRNDSLTLTTTLCMIIRHEVQRFLQNGAISALTSSFRSTSAVAQISTCPSAASTNAILTISANMTSTCCESLLFIRCRSKLPKRQAGCVQRRDSVSSNWIGWNLH